MSMCMPSPKAFFDPFLNFHRPCLFPIEVEDDKGRRRQRYRDADVETTYERIKSLLDAEGSIKANIVVSCK